MKRINKYLFLDVDGVLNSDEWYHEEWNKDHVFPIDMNDRDDVGTTTFLAEYPKPITLMRYIRKAIDSGELVIATTDAEV